MLHLVSYWPDKLQLFLLLSFKIYFEVHYISAKIEEAHHRCNKIKKDKPKKTLSPPLLLTMSDLFPAEKHKEKEKKREKRIDLFVATPSSAHSNLFFLLSRVEHGGFPPQKQEKATDEENLGTNHNSITQAVQ